MADSPTPNEQISQAIQDSSAKAENYAAGRLSGLESVISKSTEEEAVAQKYIDINKQLEEFLNKTRLSKADITSINSLLNVQYEQSNDITKSMTGKEPLNARNKRDLKAIINLSQTILETNRSIVETSKRTISNKAKEISLIKEQIKLDSEKAKAEAKAAKAKAKAEEKYKAFKPSYKPTSEFFKFAIDYSAHVAEHNAANPDNQKSTNVAKAALGLGAVTEGVSVGVKSASGLALKGMSGGLGGVLNGAADFAHDTASGAASIIGGLVGIINTGAGAAVAAFGKMAADLGDAVVKPAIEANMIHLEAGIRKKVFNASVGKLGGFNYGLTGSSGISLIRNDLTMDEVAKIQGLGANAGISFGKDNPLANQQFEQVAAASKLWGDSSIETMRTVAFATGDYSSALNNLNSIMVSSRQGAKNMNMSVEAVAQQMAGAGLQARLMGTDAISAMGVYRHLVGSKANIESYMRSGVDLSKEGGAIVGGLAGVGKNADLAHQYYFASQYDGELNPLKAGFKMKYGDQTTVQTLSNGLVKMMGKEGKDFYSARAIQSDFKSKHKDFLKSNGGDEEAAYRQLHEYANAMNVDDKTTDIIMQTDIDSKEGAKKVEEAIKNPTTVLSTLKSMESINQNIRFAIAGMVKDWDPVYSYIKKLIDKVIGSNERPNAEAANSANELYNHTFNPFQYEAAENKKLEYLDKNLKIDSALSPEDRAKRRKLIDEMRTTRTPSPEQRFNNGGLPGGPLAQGTIFDTSRTQYMDSSGSIHIVLDNKLLASSIRRINA